MPRPKPSHKSQQRQRTRRRLFNVALSLYTSEGYEATSVDEICKRAALSKGAFYFHFSGKKELLAEALKELENREAAGSGLVSGNTDGQARMSIAGAGDPSWDTDIPAALQLQLWARALRQEEVRHYLRQRRARIVSELRRACKSADTDDIEALILGLAALRDGLALQSLLSSHDPIRGRLEAAAAAMGSSRDARIERRSA